ncbi:hypothetical protein [Sinorhizobium fredii]|uniref:hypothetical protein n=1 Tax=Rhizobium fredii TaxID=380 RepID=UPI003513AEB9
MSLGGDGVPGIERGLQEIALCRDLSFIPRRFRVGGRMEIKDGPRSREIPTDTCVLCGSLILDEQRNYEHPFPRWVHRLAGDAGELRSTAVRTAAGEMPTWRQLELSAHSNCNSLFARHIENPARQAIISMVEGGSITSSQMDAVLDWLDKVRSSSAHMATAFSGHGLLLDYHYHSFPNWRIGKFDRAAMFFRINRYSSPLDLWDCMDEGFLTTPGALVLRIKDLIMVTISNNYMLSPAFGLEHSSQVGGDISRFEGSGQFAPGFGSRSTRLGMGLVVGQAMRRQYMAQGEHGPSRQLREDGDGHIYSLEKGRWHRTRSLDFSKLPVLDAQLGIALASLEAVEWLILQKEQDHIRMGKPQEFIAMRSIPSLTDAKLTLIDAVAAARGGLRPPENDRI